MFSAFQAFIMPCEWMFEYCIWYDQIFTLKIMSLRWNHSLSPSYGLEKKQLLSFSRAYSRSSHFPQGWSWEDLTSYRWSYRQLDWENEVHPIRLAQPFLRLVLHVWTYTKEFICYIRHLGLLPLLQNGTELATFLIFSPELIWLVLFWFFSPFDCPFRLLFLLPFLNI